MNGWTPEHLDGVVAHTPPEELPANEVDRAHGRELIVSGVLWAGLVSSALGSVATDPIDKAYDTLVTTSHVSREVTAHIPVVPGATRAGSKYVGSYLGEKANVGSVSLEKKLFPPFDTKNLRVSPKIEEMLTNPNGSFTLNDYLQQVIMVPGRGDDLGYPKDMRLITDPRHSNDRMQLWIGGLNEVREKAGVEDEQVADWLLSGGYDRGQYQQTAEAIELVIKAFDQEKTLNEVDPEGQGLQKVKQAFEATGGRWTER